MKINLYLVSILFSFQALATPRDFWILDRKVNSNRTFYKKVILTDLISENSFNGKYFKIVSQTDSQPISFESEENLVLKAATVYYHLTKAKRFWDTFTHENINHSQLTIRLEITNQFDELGHFAHINRNPQYNNAVSIPAGKTPDWVPAGKEDKWEKEIWFRPLEYINSATLPKPETNPLEESIRRLQGPFINYTRNQFNQSMLEHLFYPNYASNPLWQDVVRFAGTVALTKLIYEGAKYSDALFMEKYYYLDTAMVPEVIYHEYSHIILSDYLELTHSTPVTEGFADYFSAVISKRRKISARVSGFSNASSRDRNNSTNYSHWHESNQMANSDFVLALLWDIREKLGEKNADELIYGARKRLKVQTATIYNHLLQALIDSCNENCDDARNKKLQLYQIFTNRGL